MSAEMDMIKFVIIGIGINVNTPESLLLPKSTSLREELGRRVSRVELTKQILREIEKEYILFQKEGFTPIIRKWKEFSTTLGHRVKVLFHKEFLEGQAIDIDSDGALLVKKDSGLVERVTAGDIVKLR
jgi:BirA family biotin operon repressor/biotin-[acetyl-CoA-carboxylase] ligase